MRTRLALALLALLIAASPEGKRLSAQAFQAPANGPGVATIWYLGHCGYAVRTARHLLTFDYIELEETARERGLSKGFVDPSEIAGLDVSVFVSHNHVDHYDPLILDWQKAIPTIRYFFGWNAGLGSRHRDMEGPRASAALDGLQIDTVNSHHSGVAEVAWLVRVDGLAIFHAGDYQGKMARGAPSNAAEDMRYLMSKAGRVDLAFVGATVDDWNLTVIRALAPSVAFPMHYRKREEQYKVFAADLAKAGIDTPVVCPARRGDRFEFRDGRVR
jgi:L-ascorbate metabolism protein UlaG (beta-lactamase superfamily)